MSRVLLVEDDADQLEIRKLLLEHAGHEVVSAQDAESARELFARWPPEIALVDLRLKTDNDGLDLVREFRTARPALRILVLSGWVEGLAGRVEAAMVDAVLPKPSGSGTLLKTVARLALMTLLATAMWAQTYPFEVGRTGEAVAEITMSSPGGNWVKAGAEAAVADVRVDDRPPFQVMVFNGAASHVYPVFLGELSAGRHKISIERNQQHSAAGAALSVAGVAFQTSSPSAALLHTPVLFARRNTIGKFSDVPLLVYAEELQDGGDPILQYTVIFSNEDGGTSTRALMARWGRTTDIEYVYRVNTRTHRAIIQSRDHKDIVYEGRLEGKHPLLMPVTDNNMVDPATHGTIRYQLAPIIVDLSKHSREQVMDDHPWSYRVASDELRREAKLRPFGTVDGEKISDPHNYLYVEAKVANRNSGLSVNVKLRGDGLWRSGALGRADYAISREGWVRTTVELPLGTRADQIEEIGLECVVSPGPERRMPLAGQCRVDGVSKAFLLDANDRPGPSLWMLQAPVELATGEMRAYRVR